MNKLNLKKLLTLLVCLTLIVSVVLLAACNKKDDNKGSTEDNTSASPSFTNGNFRSYTTSDKGYPYAPSSFTGSPTSDTEGSTLPKLETVKRGVINLADYQNLGAWCTFSKFDAKRLTDEEDAKNYNKDDNVLMINNTEARYYMYRSSEFSVAANTKYLLQVDVRTANLDGGKEKGATIKIAKSYSSGSSIPATEGYASFDAVTVGEWTTYSFIIDGKYNGSTSLELQLMLGNNNLRDEYKTSGYAFFDNIRLTTVKDDTVLPTENVKTITLSVPNGSFDYKTTSDYPYLYNRVTTTDTNSNYGLVNAVDAKDGKITLVGEYKIDADALKDPKDPLKDHGNVFAIYNVAEARMGFYTTNPLYFKRGGYYKVTVSLNTDNVESGKAYLALGKSKDLSDNTVIEIGKDAATPGWKEHVFYVYANENTADELYFHFGLGKDSGDKAKGYILIDDLKIEETDDTTQTGDYVTDNRFKPEDNKLINAFVNNNKSDDNINGVPVTITGDGEKFSENDKTPYVSSIFSESNRKFTSEKATLAKFQTTATLEKDSYYRFSVWVRTVDVPSTSGVVLTVYDGNKNTNSAVKAIATFAAVTTDKDLADSSSSLNGYRELVCYFHTASLQKQAVTFEISLGSGGAFTSSTLFSGTAYIANASLVETDYTKYNGASASGTYEKKYDWYETLSSETFTNGQFQKYNYSDTKFFKDGGVNEKGEFQSTSFGVPSGWTLKGEKDKAVAGIVDVNRENLLNNLATKLGITAEVLKAVPVDANDKPVETFGIYAGGNSYLLINSADVEGLAKESVRVGYVSNSFTLNANSYYKISVMVKVINGQASVYLMTDNNIAETNVDSKFENIEASTASQTGGWKRYTFYVKTGFSSISATLGLYLGGQDKDIALTDANMTKLENDLSGKYVREVAEDGTVTFVVYNKNTHKDVKDTYNYNGSAKGGTVLFDYVIKEDISESATASAADEYEETKRVEMNLDSFGLATTPDENKPTSPKGWTKTSLTKDTDTEQLQSGVIYSTDYKAHSGESCLIIPYLNTAGASYYASDAKTLTKDGFYKISVWAKLSAGHTGKAYITLVATNYGENSKYVDYASQTIEVNSTDWKEYVFFIKAPSSDTKIDKYGDNAKDLSLKIRLGFGESADNKASGYVLFDDVLIEKLDVKADEFDKHVNDFKAAPEHAGLTVNTVKYSAIDKEEETTPDKEPDKENNKDSGKNFNWVIFTSVAFGAIVVIAVAAFFIKKYLPKHKEGKQQVDKKKTSKKKEDDYKNLND